MGNKQKKFVFFGVTMGCVFALAACGSKKGADSSSSEKEETNAQMDTYTYVYSGDPTTLDYTTTVRNTNTAHTTNFVDGLMEFDKYGNVVPSLAEDWEVSKDGKTYTYHLRKGVKWVDNQGNEKGEVKAQDFITGLKHAVDAKSETLYIVSDSLVGLKDYADGKITDFNQVGIKALDDYTVSYTLTKPEPYWNSKTTYGILYPIQEEFLKEKGTDFGSTTPDSILYNGGYLLTNFTSKSAIEYDKNESYWDEKNVHIKHVKLTYSDGSDPDAYYRGFDEGKYSVAGIYPNSPAYKDVEAKYKDDIIWSQPNRATYNFTFNLSRRAYNSTSKKTDKEKEDTQKAILNNDFRKAILFAFDRTAYQAQSVGKAGASKAIRNSWVPRDFVSIKGQPFGEVTEKYLQEMDPEAFSDVSLADGKDNYFNSEKAKKFMEKAKQALTKENVTFPIHLDFPQSETSELAVNRGKSFKETVEKSLGKDNVQVDLQLLSTDAYNNATYLAATGSAADYDIANASGWSADYTDPQSFLHVYHSQTGDILQTIGLDVPIKGQKDATKEAKEALHLSEYDALVDKANQIVDNLDARYDAYAKAEAWLLDHVIQIPVNALGGSPSLTHSVSFEKAYDVSGGSDKFKGMELTAEPENAKEHQKRYEKWQQEKEISNKKASEEINKKMGTAK